MKWVNIEMMKRVLPKKRRIRREGMPRFLYPISFLAFAFWAGWGYLLFFVPPDGLIAQILFLGTLFLALFFTLTFLFYEISSLFKKVKPRELFYPAARRAFIIAAFFGLAGAMKLLKIANPLNLILFGMILLLTEIQITRG